MTEVATINFSLHSLIHIFRCFYKLISTIIKNVSFYFHFVNRYKATLKLMNSHYKIV